MNKIFKRGFFCGRMQHIHIGHMRIIQAALDMCDQVLIMVGSSQESGTLRNPFQYAFRRKLIEAVYHKQVTDGKLIISPLRDLTHENDITPTWGRYVLVGAKEGFSGQTPDAMFYGNDENRAGWYSPEDIDKISQIVIARGIIPVSATRLRDHLIKDDFYAWKGYVPNQLHAHYDEIRTRLLTTEPYKEMLKNGTI